VDKLWHPDGAVCTTSCGRANDPARADVEHEQLSRPRLIALTCGVASRVVAHNEPVPVSASEVRRPLGGCATVHNQPGRLCSQRER
jgi:hypothetical protein